MKEIKRLSILLFVFVVITISIIPTVDVSAKTLAELKEELRVKEEEYNNALAEEDNKENQLLINNETIIQIEKDVSKAEEDMNKLALEIEELTKEIEKKEEELKNIVNFSQKNNGSNTYLNYAFGADNLTDFIYRVSVSEQLAKYNEQLIEDSERLIEENKLKTEELKATQEKLQADKNRLNEEIAKLDADLASIATIKIDVAEEIRLQKDAIETLEEIGCKDHENIETCGNKLPSDTAFLRPMENAYVTSEYGYRCLLGSCGLHAGIDISTSSKTGNIYSAANGLVIATLDRTSCGGNIVFILHEVNGRKYTTEYAHLRTINVEDGQVVTKNTVIGTMGGDSRLEYWDKCSTGAHLHFGISSGHYLKDYTGWNTYLGNTFDPRNIINFPWTGGYVDPFGGRYEKY